MRWPLFTRYKKLKSPRLLFRPINSKNHQSKQILSNLLNLRAL